MYGKVLMYGDNLEHGDSKPYYPLTVFDDLDHLFVENVFLRVQDIYFFAPAPNISEARMHEHQYFYCLLQHYQ